MAKRNLPEGSSVPEFNEESQPNLSSGWRLAPKEKIIEGEVELTYIPKSVEGFSQSLPFLIGYGLLGLSLFNFIDIFIPPQFTNPFWEFDALGKLVDFVPVPLIAFLMIFYRREGYIRKREAQLLRFLSWFSLAISIIYFLMTPIGIVNTIRINDTNQARVDAQVLNKTKQFELAKGRIATARDDEFNDFFASAKGKNTKIPTIGQLKEKMSNELVQSYEDFKFQADVKRRQQRLELIKKSVKSNLGALLCCVLFFFIWRITLWARVT